MSPRSAQPKKPLPYHTRVVADGTDRAAWLRERSRGVTATDAARLTGEKNVYPLVQEKIFGSNFTGNAYTDHGKTREPIIVEWVMQKHPGMRPNAALFHAENSREHLATPDGLREHENGLELCEIKTTGSLWHRVPRNYLRQIWWQQYVLGAERTLLVWEQHENFVPLNPEPETLWVQRDENEIARLTQLANKLLSELKSRKVSA